MKKVKYPLALLVLLLATLLVACSREEPEKDESTHYLFYMNLDETELIKEAYEPVGQTTEELVQEFAEQLEAIPEEKEYNRLMPEGLEFLGYHMDGSQLLVNFNSEYYNLSKPYEVLLRAGIVRTFLQIPRVDGVSFTVEDIPLEDSSGNTIGVMTTSTFAENAGEHTNSYQKTRLTLYFATENGKKLKGTLVEVMQLSNVPIEKLILEKLIAGPESLYFDHVYPTLPSDTKINSVTVKEGICYVNLNEAFLNNTHAVSESIPIYSIVNSLTEASGINKVQITIDGDNQRNFRQTVSLNQLFERNLDLVITDKEEAVE